MSLARARCLPSARSALVGLGSSRTATTTAPAMMIVTGPSTSSASSRSASSLSGRALTAAGEIDRRYSSGMCPLCTGAVANRRIGLRSYTSSTHAHALQKSDTRYLHQQSSSTSSSAPSPPDIAILNTRPQSESQAPFRGADLKSESQQEIQDEQSPACASLSPSSPSAPKTQQNSAPATQKNLDIAAAAATTATGPTSSSSKRSGSTFRPRKAALSLTAKAVERLMALSESPSGPKLIRVGVRNKGCAGMSYHLEYVSPEQAGKFDERVEQDGVKVLIDSKALFSIIGSEMDWKDDKLSSKFVFNNPNIKEACGCGESFLT